MNLPRSENACECTILYSQITSRLITLQAQHNNPTMQTTSNSKYNEVIILNYPTEQLSAMNETRLQHERHPTIMYS